MNAPEPLHLDWTATNQRLLVAEFARLKARLRGDAPRAAFLKAFAGALAAGVPFPVTGTIVGAAILALSGLPSLRRR